MTRKLMLASAIATALVGPPALALELGALRTESALNQPFSGEIELGDIGPDELDAVRISIAPSEAFDKAGIERYYYLTQLSFTPEVAADGRIRVRVSSRDPVREPYMDFLVEVIWPTGRLVKGYTVLLDPPTQTARRAPNVQTARAATAASGPGTGQPSTTTGAGAYIPAPGEGFPLYIGPVGGGEGLWALARRQATAGATDAQTAMALYRSNQGAFVRGDINRLIAGKTLVIPSRAELFALDAEAARLELQAAMRGRPVQRAPLTNVTPEMLSRLRLVGTTPGATGPGVTAPPPSTAPNAAGSGGQSPDVLMAIETSETARQETIELRNRIQELESQLTDIQSLLQLRNAELARAQSVEAQVPESILDVESIEEPEPVASPPGTLTQDARDTLEPAPVEIDVPPAEEPFDLQSLLAEESADAAESGLSTEPLETELEAELSESGVGLVPVPVPMPASAESETPATASETPASQASSEPIAEPTPKPDSTPAATAAESTPPPAIESSSTWHSLLLPLAGLAGVTALGILLFSVLTARRRRQELAESEDEIDSDSELVLDPFAPPPEPETPSKAAATSAPDAVVLDKKVADAQTAEPSSRLVEVPDVPDLDKASEEVMSSLTDFDAETDEADILSEADIYIAYGRFQEARHLLDKELRRYPQRLDIKYKLAEALAASGEAGALRDLLDEIRSSGGDTQDPVQWAQMQQRLDELAPEAPLSPATPSLTPSAVAAASAGLADARADDTLESAVLPDVGSVATSGPESEDDLLLDLSSDSSSPESDVFKNADALDEALALDLDVEPPAPNLDEVVQAIEQDIDSILPASEASDGLDLDLDILGSPPPPTQAPGKTAPAAADEIGLDLDLEVPSLDDTDLGEIDLTIDGLQGAEEPQAAPKSPSLDDALKDTAEESLEALDSDLSPEQESVPSDLLSSQWQVDSSIWDETATKLDLARAYVEMDDKEAAREILEEVMAEGRDEQRNEARTMLERLG
ncbi:FimV/HubP family polar landmark protein [Allochromatium palmeri]|uniref:FimV N-terminal domain-containing protein n=1 Tax=Allochromatium palmeri TaxID=231048 RepID=A0A6N8EEU0_9GAMM|nr:FimV/HubP family polar landmark protein [Allochromatium palmeri]MTW22171.1 hypothetical protein [Allochromatium palmeri]